MKTASFQSAQPQLPQRPAERSRLAPLRSSAALSVNAAAADEPAPFVWGANMKNLGIAVGLGILIWFVPPPTGVTAQAWHLLAIFVSTIVGIITMPLPLGAVAMLGLGAAMITKTLTFAQAFSAFATEIPCVPACAFACDTEQRTAMRCRILTCVPARTRALGFDPQDINTS